MKAIARMLAGTAALLMFAAPVAQADSLWLDNDSTSGISMYFDYPGPSSGWGTYSVGGGNWSGNDADNSTLTTADGVMQLEYVYCVDMTRTISAPGTYGNTTWTDNGVVFGVAVGNKTKVDYLMDRYASVAAAAADSRETEKALQAAIWTVVNDTDGNYANEVRLNMTGSIKTKYDAMLASADVLASWNDGINTVLYDNNLTNWYWLSPKVGTTEYQGLIGGPKSYAQGIVPEGGSFALLLTGLAPLGLALRRRIRR